MSERIQTIPVMSPELGRLAEISAFVERWHFENFNSSVMGHHVDCWNLLLLAKDDLKSRLAAFIKEL